MQDHTYKILYEAEATHWWLTARREIVLDWIGHYYGGRTDLDVVDAGCGTGLMLVELETYGRIRGFDISEYAIEFCRQRGLVNAERGDVTQLPLPGESADFVTAVDVLEHLDDDCQALAEWFRVLRPGGRLFLFVPAHRWLWSLQDEVSGHKRRYTKAELERKIGAAGFEIERSSYVSTLLFPLIWGGRLAIRVIRRFRALTTENTLHPKWSNPLLRSIFLLERPLLRRTNLPFGASVLSVGKKAAEPALQSAVREHNWQTRPDS
jgi:SAM-dependent methyltransferase